MREDGTTEGAPREIVSMLTGFGNIIDDFNRYKVAAGTPDDLMIDWEIKMDDVGPEDSVAIADTSTGKFIDTFAFPQGMPLCD